MNDIIKILTSVVTTLQNLHITSTYDNMDKLLGSIHALNVVIDQLRSDANPEQPAEPQGMIQPKEETPIEIEEINGDET